MQKGIAIFQYGGAWGLPYEGPLLSHFLIVVLTEFALCYNVIDQV